MTFGILYTSIRLLLRFRRRFVDQLEKHQDSFIRNVFKNRRRRRQHFESSRTLLPETGSRRRISNSAAAVGTFGALTFPKNQRPSAHLTWMGGGGGGHFWRERVRVTSQGHCLPLNFARMLCSGPQASSFICPLKITPRRSPAGKPRPALRC